jgi:hypothetical protein
MRKTELAARQYQHLVAGERTGTRTASVPIATPLIALDAIPIANAAPKTESAR